MGKRQATPGWTGREFAGLDLDDARLINRAKKLIETFAAKPKASIPKACDNWTGAHARPTTSENQGVYGAFTIYSG